MLITEEVSKSIENKSYDNYVWTRPHEEGPHYECMPMFPEHVGS
jgi:hypothetical protein